MQKNERKLSDDAETILSSLPGTVMITNKQRHIQKVWGEGLRPTYVPFPLWSWRRPQRTWRQAWQTSKTVWCDSVDRSHRLTYAILSLLPPLAAYYRHTIITAVVREPSDQ